MIEFSRSDDVAVLSIDDGKVNAEGNAFIDALNTNLDRASTEAKAVVIAGGGRRTHANRAGQGRARNYPRSTLLRG